MAKNKVRVIAVILAALVLFLAGGWFFTSLPRWRAPQGEVEEMYTSDGESLGIFDNIPAEDLAAAEAVAAYGLNQDVTLPEDQPSANRADGSALPSQIVLTEWNEIQGVAPVPEKEEDRFEKKPSQPVNLNLSGNEKTAGTGGEAVNTDEEEESRISMIKAPVKQRLIKDTDEYKRFKTVARGSYPEVNFKKQMIIVLESESNLPDKVFEIQSATPQDGKLVVKYRVNVFDLDKKINTHAVFVVDKTDLPLKLEQIL